MTPAVLQHSKLPIKLPHKEAWGRRKIGVETQFPRRSRPNRPPPPALPLCSGRAWGPRRRARPWERRPLPGVTPGQHPPPGLLAFTRPTTSDPEQPISSRAAALPAPAPIRRRRPCCLTARVVVVPLLPPTPTPTPTLALQEWGFQVELIESFLGILSHPPSQIP